VLFSADLQADKARQIFYPYKMSHVVIVLYVQQINMLVHFSIGEPNRKNQEFFFFLDGIHVDRYVIESFKLFNLI